MTRSAAFLYLSTALLPAALLATGAFAHQPPQTPESTEPPAFSQSESAPPQEPATLTGIPESLIAPPPVPEPEPPAPPPAFPEPPIAEPPENLSFFTPQELEILEYFDTQLLESSARFLPAEPSLLGITPTTRCREITYTPGDIMLLAVAPFADLRIEMPVPIQTLKLGGGTFWEATHAEGTRHLWLKSASLTPEAAETSLTVLDQELNAYDIILQRENVPGYTCAIVSLSPEMDFEREMTRALGAAGNASPSAAHGSDGAGGIFLEQLAALQEEVADLRLAQANSTAAMQQAAVNRIAEIHSQIYAGYAWSPEDDDDPYAQRLAESILSVHDDGVRTFIRVQDMPSVGLIAIQGSYAGETQLVQTAYDPLLGMYTVTGIYDRLLVSGGAEDARAVIDRIAP